jgi:hypothetical protein
MQRAARLSGPKWLGEAEAPGGFEPPHGGFAVPRALLRLGAPCAISCHHGGLPELPACDGLQTFARFPESSFPRSSHGGWQLTWRIPAFASSFGSTWLGPGTLHPFGALAARGRAAPQNLSVMPEGLSRSAVQSQAPRRHLRSRERGHGWYRKALRKRTPVWLLVNAPV